MSLDQPPSWFEAVRANGHRTTGFLLASTQPCIRIRDEELDAVRQNRVLVGLTPADLEAWQPPPSWLLAIVLCPGDTTEGLAAWARRHKVDPARVHFYLHPKTPWEALRAWHDAGFPTHQVDDDVDGWGRLHKLFGLALSERIVLDAGSASGA